MRSKTRLTLTVDGAGVIAVKRTPFPKLSRGGVLVRVKSSLVSPGTELGGVPGLRAEPQRDAGPRPFGYGNAGIVLEAGTGVKEIRPSMRVACMGAGYALHADYVVVPQNLVVPIPGRLSFDEAAFGHLAATALHAVRRAKLEFGQNALVAGLGIVGQVIVQLCRASGVHTIAMDRIAMRLRVAARCGADYTVNSRRGDLVARTNAFTRGHGVDVAFVAFGGEASEALQSILATIKTAPDGHRMGAIVIVGGAVFKANWPVPLGNIDVRASSRPGPGYHDEDWERGREYPKVFVEWTTRRNLEEVLRAAAEGKIRFGPLITHRVPLREGPAACEELVNHPERALGVVLHP